MPSAPGLTTLPRAAVVSLYKYDAIMQVCSMCLYAVPSSSKYASMLRHCCQHSLAATQEHAALPLHHPVVLPVTRLWFELGCQAHGLTITGYLAAFSKAQVGCRGSNLMDNCPMTRSFD
jgi:hypothetical protein